MLQAATVLLINVAVVKNCDNLFIIYLFTTLFNVGHAIVTRVIKTNLTKTNTDIIYKNFKIFDMQYKNRESLVHDPISVWIL